MRICTFEELDNEFSTLSKSGEFKKFSEDPEMIIKQYNLGESK